MIVGITGRKGSGKTTAAKALLEIGFYQMSFASTLKQMVHVLLCDVGLSVDEVTHYQTYKEVGIPQFGVSYRHLCQTLGTEWGREHVHTDLWVIAKRNQLARIEHDVVFDDVRFENEARLIRERGGLIVHLRREGVDADTHRSESGIYEAFGDAVIFNDGDDVDRFKRKVLGVVHRRLEHEYAAG